MTMKKDLQVVSKELKALSKKVDKLIVAAGKSVKTKPVKKSKAKSIKKVTAKKTPPKLKPVKKVATKKAAPKKTAKVTAADTVFAVIKKSKKGVDTATLMEKTGFNRVKIANNVKVLKKKGKINSPKMGIYVKA